MGQTLLVEANYVLQLPSPNDQRFILLLHRFNQIIRLENRFSLYSKDSIFVSIKVNKLFIVSACCDAVIYTMP